MTQSRYNPSDAAYAAFGAKRVAPFARPRRQSKVSDDARSR